MAREEWPLRNGRPIVSIALLSAATNQFLQRVLLADTGAGDAYSGFDVLLAETDCMLCGGHRSGSVVLGGSYVGTFTVYVLRVTVGGIGFDHFVSAVGVPAPPAGYDGIAGLRFLNRFTYGNFGDFRRFGLEL